MKLSIVICLGAASVLSAQNRSIMAVGPTPAEAKITQARAAIEKDPKRADPYNALAAALIRRARETSNRKYYAEAQEALKKVFAINPEDFDGQKEQTAIYLGNHEFEKARDLARKLNRKTPDDVAGYGLVVDACMELGDYKEAEVAAQWMLDLRPANVPGLERGAALREVFGDVEGARDFLNQSFQRVRPEETEERSWILTQLSRLALTKEDPATAERLVNQALRLFLDYPLALRELARVRFAKKDYASASEAYERLYGLAPETADLYDWGVALSSAGRTEDATRRFSEFEKQALAQVNQNYNSNPNLVKYYLDQAHKPAEALQIARSEAKLRQDVHNLDLYAWALYANGDYQEAKKQMDKALAPGIKEPGMLSHAAAISLKLPGAGK